MENNINIELSEKRRAMREFARRIDKIIKDEIRRQDLIDTGKMIGAIKSKVTIGSMGQMDVDVKSTDYFKYVDGNFNILSNAYTSPAFTSVLLDFITFKNRFKK
jgi:hypothetical protein